MNSYRSLSTKESAMHISGAWVTLPLNCKKKNVHVHNVRVGGGGGGGMEIEQLYLHTACCVHLMQWVWLFEQP